MGGVGCGVEGWDFLEVPNRDLVAELLHFIKKIEII